jgi:hypothetical protein
MTAISKHENEGEERECDNDDGGELSVNTSSKAGAQILHSPLGDDSSPSRDNTVGR